MSANQSTAKMNWDLVSYFPEYGGPEMKEFKKKLKADIAARGKRPRSSPLSTKATWPSGKGYSSKRRTSQAATATSIPISDASRRRTG